MRICSVACGPWAKKRRTGFALPSEVDSWWKARNRMFFVRDGSSWRIESRTADCAVLAFAQNVEGKLVYKLSHTSATG
jgi:hypothetical protein